MHTCSGPNAPNAFLASRFLPSPSPSGPAGDAGSWPLAAGCWPLPYPGPIATPRGAARSRHKPAEDREASPRTCRPAPRRPTIPAPERWPIPDPRPSPRPHRSGRVHAFPGAALGWLTRTRAPSSRSSSPQPQAPGAGSALLRDAARRRGGGAPAVPPPPSRGPDCGG